MKVKVDSLSPSSSCLPSASARCHLAQIRLPACLGSVKLVFLISTGVARLVSADLVAYFNFDNADDLGANTGSIATDWNQFANVTQSPGRFGAGAGNFVAGSSQAWDADFSVGVLESFSVSLHVKSEQAASWDDFVSIGTGNNVVFVLERNGAEGVSIYNIGEVGGVASNAVSYSPGATVFDVDDGEWHHLGMTVGDGTITLYIDGEPRGTSAYEGVGPISAFQIASRFGAGVRAITAEIDDVAVYSETLGGAEMAFLANNPAVSVASPASPEIVSATWTGGAFEMLVGGLIPGRRYLMTRSDDLVSGVTESVGNPVVAGDNLEIFRDQALPATRAFYRVEEVTE